MARTKHYMYCKSDKAMYRIYYTDNLIEQYEYTILSGEKKGTLGYSYSFKSLLNDKTKVFGKLKTLKVLYAEVKG